MSRSLFALLAGRLFALFLTASAFLPIAGAQQNPDQQDPLQIRNPVPWGSYQQSDFDTVNLMNGSIAIHIPLYSLPQRGRLSLSYTLTGTSPVYGVSNFLCRGHSNCLRANFNWGPGIYNSRPVSLIFDQALIAVSRQIRYPANSNDFYNLYSIQDESGTIHQLGYDNANRQLLRATDGTGFLYNPQLSPSYSPYLTFNGGTIYTASGTRHIYTTSTYTIEDPDGNSINSSLSPTAPTTDSLGRSIPALPTSPSSSSITGCPVVTAPYQAATGSSNLSPV